jgi:hypothetical protein
MVVLFLSFFTCTVGGHIYYFSKFLLYVVPCVLGLMNFYYSFLFADYASVNNLSYCIVLSYCKIVNNILLAMRYYLFPVVSGFLLWWPKKINLYCNFINLIIFLFTCSIYRRISDLNLNWLFLGTLMKTGPVRDAQQTKQGAYNIPCDCSKCYIGEKSRPVEVCIKEHKYNLTQDLLEKQN